MAAVAPFWVSACHLVDQSSFGNAPRPPAPDQLVAALSGNGTAAIAVIHPWDGFPYQDTLRQAIALAEARRPRAHYTIVSVAPEHGSIAAQQSALLAATGAARQILDSMEEDGIAEERIALSAQTNPALDTPEIRIYVDGG